MSEEMEEIEATEKVPSYDEEGMEVVNSGNESEEEEEVPESAKKAYLPGKAMEPGEELVCDDSAYVMFHQGNTGTPCLSFDILRDDDGGSRETFPLSCYVVAGTQEELNFPSQMLVMKFSNLTQMELSNSDDSESSSESSDSEDEEKEEKKDKKMQPNMDIAPVKHSGCVNRIRVTQTQDRKLAALWSENGHVSIYDLNKQLEAVNDSVVMAKFVKNPQNPPVYTFRGHPMEGFAMDWSPTVKGRLATGDCKKHIHLWSPAQSGWKVDQRPFAGHTSSVEDIQWSPVEENVFASCSVDKTLRIWDARAAPSKANMLTVIKAHTKDVNVISWNKQEPYIISGSDDAMLKIWDLRKLSGYKPVATFKHHTGPITSVEWNPNDNSVFAASGQDNQITLWDLSVERDNDDPDAEKNEPNIPPNLLFIHQGQQEIKEVHWHPQLPGVLISTAASGFNVFRTISV